MSGFGTGLQEKTINSNLFRKVSFENFLNEGVLCTSTENSAVLSSHGEFCLVYPKKEYTGEYDNQDADAGKNFGYDEFRVELSISDADYIVVPDSWFDSEMDINADDYSDENDPYEWIEKLNEYVPVISESKAMQMFNNIDFNF